MVLSVVSLYRQLKNFFSLTIYGFCLRFTPGTKKVLAAEREVGIFYI
jgi:hypothetical protein